jgi:uncharacterized glyoxalase superfamily protein PhnB
MARKKPARRSSTAKRKAPEPRTPKVKPVPDGFRTVTAYLFVPGTVQLIEFLKAAFDATEIARHDGPSGEVMYAQMQIGDSMIMLSEPREPWKPMPCGIFLYVKDTDLTYRWAIAAGATSLMEPSNQFYGDRNAGVRDPFGNNWWIGTHIEDVPTAELKRRMRAM